MNAEAQSVDNKQIHTQNVMDYALAYAQKFLGVESKKDWSAPTMDCIADDKERSTLIHRLC